ncbi:MAG: hypothetical protein Q9170_002075 [Blastenia crenularia]
MYRNYTFLGRDEELKDIHKALHPRTAALEDESRNEVRGNAVKDELTKYEAQLQKVSTTPSNHIRSPACCIIQGLGGIGKTQTALEYSFTSETNYDAISWVRSELESTLGPTYALIAKELGLTKDLGGHDGQNQGQTIDRARHWLSTTNDFTTINLKNLDRDRGSDLIFKYLKRKPNSLEEEEYARKIADLLGGLPLALATIGGYISQTEDTVSGFFESLKTSSNAWEASAIGPAKQYEKTLSTVFELALREIPEDARSLLNILAFLNPDQIPESLFLNELGRSSFPFLSTKAK